MKEIIKEFKEIYKVKIVPMLKEKYELDSKINELNSKRSELDSKRSELDSKRSELDSKMNELDSKINELNSKINELYSKRSELNSKRSELYSKIYKLDLNILKIFSEFENKHNLVIEWENYNFELKDISFKYYNKAKTGFIYSDMKGKTREELFKPKIETEKIINGKKYRLVEE